MRILILSRSKDNFFNHQMVQEGNLQGIGVDVLNPMDCLLCHKDLLYKGKPLNKYDFCFLRSPFFREEKDYFHLAARIIEANYCPVINSPGSVEISGDKFRTKIVLDLARIPVLPSVAVRQLEDIDESVRMLGGYPVFLKTFFGTRGIGVLFCPCRETLIASAQTMWAYHANVFIEKYAVKSAGETVRVLIFNGKVLGSLINRASRPTFILENNEINGIKQPSRHDFNKLVRSNYSRGGEVEHFTLDKNLENISISASKTLGLKLAGVDLIEDYDGWKVLEINSSPGIESFKKITGSNVAKSIIDELIRAKD